MNIDIRADAKAVRLLLQEDARQAPFAASLAINNVIKDAQKALHEGYARRFTLRRPDFIRREGAKITKFSTKRSLDAEIRVTDKAGFLTKFEEGEPKTPREGKAIAIPVAVRRTKTDIVPTSQRPPALYRSKGRESGRIFSRGGKLLQRIGRGARATLRVLYIWKSSARTPAILKFKETVNQAVDKNWPRRALEAVDRAIATRK